VLYFDHNATHPLCAAAREAWLDAVERFPANPSSPHRLGARADAALDAAREKLARFLGCEPRDIVWTSGATESANAAVAHLAAGGEGEAWVSAIEHPSVLEPVRRWFPGRHRLIPALASGIADLDWLADTLCRARPAFVALQAANNETGILQPWRAALALCREREVPFFCDAAQWAGKLPAAGLGACDFAGGCAHKFGGPPGVGFLKVPARGFRPLLVGGGQEEGRRAGTENVPGILAMIAALDAREAALAAGGAEERTRWRGRFCAALAERLPGAEIIGAGAERLWNTVSAAMPALDDCRQRWVVKLDRLGFAVSTGSACASGREKPSHVLSALGIPPEKAGRVLRFSSGWETGAEEWERLLDGVVTAWGELQGAQPAHRSS
jgi:cysteine desulfurase